MGLVLTETPCCSMCCAACCWFWNQSNGKSADCSEQKDYVLVFHDDLFAGLLQKCCVSFRTNISVQSVDDKEIFVKMSTEEN